MAGKSLGTLTIDLIAEVAGFVKGMDKAERSADEWRKNVASNVKLAGASVAGMVGIAATAAASISAAGISLVKSTSEHVAETDRWAKSLGMSTSSLMKWQYAAEKAGLSADNISDIFKDMNDKIGDAVLNKSGEAAQALDTLGLSAKKLQNLSPDKQLLAISSAMKGMNTAQKTNIFEGLGNDLSKLSPLLDNGAVKLKAYLQQASDLKIAPKDEDVEKLLKVNQFFQDLESSAESLKMEIATGLANVDLSPIQKGMDDLRNTLTDPSVLEGLTKLVGGTAELVGWMGKLASETASFVSHIMDVPDRFKAGGWYNYKIQQNLKGQVSDLLSDVTAITSQPGTGQHGGDYKLGKGESNQGKKPPATKVDHAALKLDSSFKSTEQAYLRQISLIDTTGKKTAIVTEQQKLAFDLSTGKLNGLNSAQQERLKSLAKEVDRLNEVKKANENNAKVAEYVNSLHKENLAKQQGLDADFISAYSGNDQRSRLKDVASIKQDFAVRQTELQTQYDSGDIDKDLYDKKTKALSDSLNEQLSIQSDYYQKVDSLRGNYSAGFISGFADQAQAASDLYTNMQQVGSEAFSNLTDMIVNWAETGKLNAQDFAATFLESVGSALISYAAAQVAMAGLEAFTAMVGIPFVGPAVAPGAAIAAAAAAGVLAVGVGSALKGMAHDGIDSVPETGTWLLQKGERVTTAQTSAKLDATLDRVATQSTGGNSYSPSLTFHVNGDPSDSQIAMMKKAASDGAKQGYQMAVNSIGTRTGDLHKVLMSRTNAGVKKR